MEYKEDSSNFLQTKDKQKRKIDGSDLECDPNQNIHLSQTKCIDQSEDSGTHHIKSYNCDEKNTYVDLLKYRVPVLVVRGQNKSEIPEHQSQDPDPLRGNKSGASDGSAKPDGTGSGERQSLVVNLKDKADISVCGKDNNEVFIRLREGVCDLANICAIQGHIEKEEDFPAEHLRSKCITRRKDAGSCGDNPSAEGGVQKCGSQSDLVSANSEVMEVCQSCAHIYKGSTKHATSNPETQTVNHIISRGIVTDTDTSAQTTCSSHTAAMGIQRAQTATCSQTTQKCEATLPVYATASCKTSVPKSDNIQRIILKPWAARKYNDMCICAELGVPCTCANRNVSSWEMVLPRNTSWWPKLKKIILIIAAIIPFICLIVYSVYYYRFRAN